MGSLKTYSISSDVALGVIDSNKLNAELSASPHITNFHGLDILGDDLKVLGDSFVSESGCNDVIYDHVATTLDEYKVARKALIDKRTYELVREGFTYDTDKVFSMSQWAQINMTTLQIDKANISYPKTWNTIDNLDSYDITDATDAQAFYDTAQTHKNSHLATGKTLRVSIAAAVDVAAVDAIVDAR